MNTSFIAIHKASGKAVQLAGPEAAAAFLQKVGKEDYDLHLSRKVDLRFSQVERIEPELRNMAHFAGDRRYDLLTDFCAYLDVREIAFCREADEGHTNHRWVELAEAKRD